jgi:hypothetical protein
MDIGVKQQGRETDHSLPTSTQAKKTWIYTSLHRVLLGGVPVTTVWRVLRLQMEEQPPGMEVSCEYIEYVAVDKR